MKYYFLTFAGLKHGNLAPSLVSQCIKDTHPFEQLKGIRDFDKDSDMTYNLVCFQEITEVEFELWKSTK